MTSKGYYSVIQYCPDLSRQESANIGVLLFCQEEGFLDALTVRNNERIRKFFGRECHDWKKINSFKLGIEERVRNETVASIDDLREFIDRRANQFRITEPRTIRVQDPQQQLADLFSELVGGPHRREKTIGVREQLSTTLDQPELSHKLYRRLDITVPIDGQSLHVPYAFQNGRFNLIQPARFRSENPLSTVYRYAVEGNSIYKHPHEEFGDMQLLLVGQFRSDDDENEPKARRILEPHNVKLFSTDELGKLVDEILTTGKDINQ